jgi:N-carbamoyl-L-amino-acid hydrolase
MALHQLNIYQMLLARREPGSLHAYLEIHIEQGPVLEERQCPVGIVEAFAGLFKWTIRFTGQPDHAGTTPMPMRRDALGGLTEFAAGIPLILYSEGSEDSVATIGKVDLFPGTANTVPGQAEFSLDVRDPDARVLEALEQAFREALMKIAQRRKLDVECDILSTIPPVACDQEIIERITRAAEALQTPYHAMQSGAIHDAQILSRLTRVGMIFVPSKGGRSHSPEEWTRWEDIEVGANVALHTLLALADIPTPEPENQTA